MMRLEMNEKTIYRVKYFLYATSFIWVLCLTLLCHELGHVIAIVSLGGTIEWFGTTADLCLRVSANWEGVSLSSLPQVRTLTYVSGGTGAMLFFMILTHKSRWFNIPALFCLLGGFAEALYLADVKLGAAYGAATSVVIICISLFWQFGTREHNNEKEMEAK